MLNFLKMTTEKEVDSLDNFILVVMKTLAILFVCELTNLFKSLFSTYFLNLLTITDTN